MNRTDQAKIIAEFMGRSLAEVAGSDACEPMRYELILAELARRVMVLEQALEQKDEQIS